MSTDVNVQVSQMGRCASEGRARRHAIMMDRPEAKGGEDRGAMGGETLLMGLGGCFMSNLLAAAAARQIEASGVRFEIRAVLENSPPRFTAVELIVDADFPDRDRMAKLIAIAERGCIVANTLKTSLDLTIRLSDA